MSVQVPKQKFQSPLGILNYLSYYVMGTAISDERIISDDDDQVYIKTKQRKGKRGTKTWSMSRQEFIDAYTSHILPRCLSRIRYRGIYNGNRSAKLPQMRECLAAAHPDRDLSVLAKLREETKVVAADGSEEFGGDRAGSTTYRVICPHDKTPMLLQSRLKGSETMQYLVTFAA